MDQFNYILIIIIYTTYRYIFNILYTLQLISYEQVLNYCDSLKIDGYFTTYVNNAFISLYPFYRFVIAYVHD